MNAMTLAFVIAADVSANADNASAIKYIAGKQSKFKAGWNLSASYKTYQALKAQGYVS